MGKVNPRAFRQTTTFKVPSRWFATRQQFAQNLQIDEGIRKLIRAKFRDGGVERIEIERSAGEIVIFVRSAKPGVIIGRCGAQIDELKKEIKQRFFGSEKIRVTMNIHEVKSPDLSAELVYQSIRDQLEARVPFRRAIKRTLENVDRAGAKGVKIQVSGRLNGAEIARTEKVSRGRLPLQTLRANIDYSRGVAVTTYGVIGIKVWIYKGDVFDGETPDDNAAPRRRQQDQRRSPRAKRAGRIGGRAGKGPILRKKSDVDKAEQAKVEAKTAKRESTVETKN